MAESDIMPSPRPTAGTRSRALMLAALRAIWIALALLVLAFFFSAVPVALRQMYTLCAGNDCTGSQLSPADARALAGLGISLGFYAWSEMLWAVVIMVTLLVVAAAIFWRPSKHRMAILTSFWLLAFFPIFYNGLMERLIQAEPGWYWPITVVEALGVWFSLIIFYLFPSGRFSPVQARWMLLPTTAYALTLLFFASWIAVLDGLTPLDRLLQFMFWGFLLVGLAAQVYRYRHLASPVERQQTKWMLFGTALFVLEDIGFQVWSVFFSPSPQQGVLRLLYNYIGTMLTNTCLLLFVLSLAIAILRYRLWDIDLLIRRTLIYGLLTGLLVLFYFGSVVVLQGLFRSVMEHQSDTAIIVSTLAVAALFAPLRSLIQNRIDRRFYRRKYDAQQVLAGFGARMREEVDLHKLTDELLAIVEETMAPEYVSVWWKNMKDLENEK